jgi:hypothetical protein
MKGSDSNNKYFPYFIFPWFLYLFGVIGDAFNIAMARVEVTHRRYICLGIPQKVTQAWVIWISNEGFFFPFNNEARMS